MTLGEAPTMMEMSTEDTTTFMTTKVPTTVTSKMRNYVATA